MKKLQRHQRLFIIAAIIYVCGAFAFMAAEHITERGNLIKQIDHDLFMAIDAAEHILPLGYGDRAVTEDAITPEEYASLKKNFTKYANDYGIQYLYSMYRAPNGIIYETATSDELENDDPFYYFRESGEMFDGRIGELDYMFEPGADGKNVYLEYYDVGLFTYNRVACKQKIAPKGTVYLICADSELKFVESRLRASALKRMAYLLFLFALVVPLFLAYRERGKIKEGELKDIVRHRTEELSLALREANMLNHAKSEFLANMSHELRTPLNAIIGFSELIMIDQNSEKHKEYGRLINISGQHLLSLINDILDFTKLESSKYSLNEEIVDILPMSETVKGIISGYKNASEKNISYLIEDNIPKIRADRRILQQAILNLMSNAVKFTDKEDSRIELKATYDKATGRISLTVSDNGIGIKKEEQNNIFDPFVQVSNAFNKNYEGTGLGLALVHRFTHLHGGEIHLQSSPGKGSVFEIVFPSSRTVKP